MAEVLVVDDDAVSRLLLSHMLARLGFEVVTAERVDEAQRTIGARPFQLVFVDYELPDGSGLDLLDALGRGGTRPRFVLVTGVLEPDDLDDERLRQVDAYLTKPISSQALARCVARLGPAPGPPGGRPAGRRGSSPAAR